MNLSVTSSGTSNTSTLQYSTVTKNHDDGPNFDLHDDGHKNLANIQTVSSMWDKIKWDKLGGAMLGCKTKRCVSAGVAVAWPSFCPPTRAKGVATKGGAPIGMIII